MRDCAAYSWARAGSNLAALAGSDMAGPFRRERRARMRARSVQRTDARCGQQGMRRFRYADYPTRAARVSVSLIVRRAAHVRRSGRRPLTTSTARSIARSEHRPFAASPAHGVARSQHR
ncbi:hypothetical protein CA831_22850, partial [Burkholderia multivorans]